MSKPLVSIKCLAYNHGPYIEDALKGFVSQKTDFPFEVIVHDDASTDQTAEVIRRYAAEYPDIIKPVFEAVNQYSRYYEVVEPMINELMTGKYIAFCEGDDYFTDPLKLQKQVDYLEAHPDVNMVYGRVERIDALTGRKIDTWGGAAEKFDDLVIGNTVPTPTVMFRRDVYQRFRKEIDLGSHKWRMGDFPMWLYFAATGGVRFMPETFSVYRVMQQSASHPDSLEKWILFQEDYRDIKLYFLERYHDDAGMRRRILEEHIKLLLRRRIESNPSLSPIVDWAIDDAGLPWHKKVLYRILNSGVIGKGVGRSMFSVKKKLSNS